MLTQEQHDEFDAQGFIRLRGVFAADQASAMEDTLWRALERKHGVIRAESATWHLPPALGLAKLRTLTVFEPIGGPSVTSALDGLIGAGCWDRPRCWGSFLISFPQSTNSKSRPNFHTDFPYDLSPTRICGALIIGFINAVPASAGGTLVVAGSHRRIAAYMAANPHLRDVKMKVTRQALLASDPYLRAFRGGWTQQNWAAALPPVEDTDTDPLQLVELTGAPGDVVIGHPWLLHSPAPNRSSAPRMMTVARIRAHGRTQNAPD